MDRAFHCRKNSTGYNKKINIQTNSSHPWGTTGNRIGAPNFHINDLPHNLISNVRLFADDCLLYLPDNDTSLPQNDILKLEGWQITWL